MQGFQAIEAANGWVISAMGISIVFSALVLLSLSIAAMPKLLDTIDRNLRNSTKKKEAVKLGPRPEPAACPVTPPEEVDERILLTQEQWEAFNYMQWITARLGEPFSLPMLLEYAEKRGVHRPHYYLDFFLSKDLVIESPVQTGLHIWNREIPVACKP